jgi:Cu(I)/Ag(I) efflux system protein CusF
MHLTHSLSVCLSTIKVGVLCGAVSASALAAEMASMPDPLDASAPVAAPRYENVLPSDSDRAQNNTDAERAPRRTGFDANGRFTSTPALLTAPVDKNHEAAHAGQSPASSQITPPMAAMASDARGIIKSIDRKRARIKLKHGPINKFDMPGMTMLFRVKDLKLLEQVAKGDEVGVTVEMDRGAMYITGFQK